jgi:hypothetical protein
VIASRDLPPLERRIDERAADLTVERRWAVEHAGLTARGRELDVALSIDAGARGHAVAHDPPAYLTDRLGPVPDDPKRRIEWERAAGGIEQHRAIYGITDVHRALGLALERSDVSDRAIEQQQLERQARHLRHAAVGPQLAPRPGPELGL